MLLTVSHFGVFLRELLLILAVLSLAPGCAATRNWREKLAGPPDERQIKRENAMAEFERRRTEAQIKTASARLDQGDTSEARRILTEILARQRDCRPASLLLADVCVEEEDWAGAEEVLLAALRQNTQAADVHHALGSLLEVADRLPEAKAHFTRACQLAPNNLAFAESLTGLEEIEPTELLVATPPETPKETPPTVVAASAKQRPSLLTSWLKP